MLSIIEIEKSNLEHFIRLAYLGDDEGIFKYHVEPLDYEQGVIKTLAMIQQMEALVRMQYYAVTYNDMPIGYFCFFKECLYSFGINIAYRGKRGLLNEWWSLVKSVMGDAFACVLQRNNERAINFLKKIGMYESEIPLSEPSFITLINL
jgi:hypothetical protein